MLVGGRVTEVGVVADGAASQAQHLSCGAGVGEHHIKDRPLTNRHLTKVQICRPHLQCRRGGVGLRGGRCPGNKNERNCQQSGKYLWAALEREPPWHSSSMTNRT